MLIDSALTSLVWQLFLVTSLGSFNLELGLSIFSSAFSVFIIMLLTGVRGDFKTVENDSKYPL